MRIGVFGGTFNPPHQGHLSAALAARRQLGLEAILLIPAGIPPHKALPPGSAEPWQRLEMARLLALGIPGAQALDLELRRPGASYTVDTLRQLAGEHPGDELWLIVGSDMLLSFDRWREPREILRLAGLAAVSRHSGDRAALEAQADALRARWGARIVLVDAPALEMSSTEARQGAPVAQLPAAIACYVAAHRLYGAEAQLAALRRCVRSRLGDRRFEHTLGTEDMAARLARAHGEDVARARMAALLHDITKEVPVAEQLQLLEDHGIITNYPDGAMEAVLHADSGALVARLEFGQSPEVCDAICYHTTGRPGMSRLEKIIYVADKIEETREFGDVPAIRAFALGDLDRAVRAVLRGALAALYRQGETPYRRTLEALRELEKNKPD